MARRMDMDMVIYNGSRREDSVRINADVDDTEELADHLEGWLDAHRIPRNRWAEFTADVHGPKRPVRVRPMP